MALHHDGRETNEVEWKSKAGSFAAVNVIGFVRGVVSVYMKRATAAK